MATINSFCFVYNKKVRLEESSHLVDLINIFL